MKNENVVITQDAIEHLSLEGEGGTQCRVRGKVNKAGLICTPSSVLRTSSPSMGKGFTLIELLVVVLIIGILAAVALPQYKLAVAKSRYAKLKHMVRALVEAEEVYYLANGDYTTNMNELDVEISNGTVNTQWEYHGDSSKQYLYNFGSCQLVNNIDDKRVMCVDNEINMGYREYLHHSPNYAGQRRCDVRGSTDDTDWRLSICKMETNNGAREGSASASVKTWTY